MKILSAAKLFVYGLIGVFKGLDALVNDGMNPKNNPEAQVVDKSAEEAYETGWDDSVSGEPRNNVTNSVSYEHGYNDGIARI